MQFTNTSGVTSQTDTNQHNAGGELHARLRNDEQHTSTPGPAGVEGAGGAGGPDRGAGGRRRSLSTHKRQARPIGGAARPAGPGRGAGGRWWRCTRYVAVHPLCGSAPEQKGCNAYGSGVAHAVTSRFAAWPPLVGTQSSPAPQPGPVAPGKPVGPRSAGIHPARPASSVARWTPPRPASCAAWVRQEKPSARYTASGFADRDGSSECDATATDRS